MASHPTIAGYIAVICFLLFTGIGACAQVYKLGQRTRAWRRAALERDRICDGLHPVREMWSFSAFLLFALSGLTRSYVDYFLLLSRLPVVILSTVIIWFLYYHGKKGAGKFFILAVVGDIALIALIVSAFFGYRPASTGIPLIVDGGLSVVGVLLFYGKQLQAVTMYRVQRSQAVSWLRESGLVIKDITGLWYALGVGSELFWVSITHMLSAVSSITICAVKFVVERNRV